MVFTEQKPDWLEFIVPERFNDKDLFRIVTFFVFHSPCTELSSMSRSLAEYGWHTPWRKPHYLNRHLRKAASNFDLIFSAKNYDAMEETLEKANLKDDFPTDLSLERIGIYNNQSNQFLSVFYHLRNSFAHGRLNMFDVSGECVFVFEDMTKHKKTGKYKVSARMILKKSTLLKWIDIIEAGEKEYIR